MKNFLSYLLCLAIAVAGLIGLGFLGWLKERHPLIFIFVLINIVASAFFYIRKNS